MNTPALVYLPLKGRTRTATLTLQDYQTTISFVFAESMDLKS